MKKLLPLLTFFLLLIIVNVLAARFWWRADLTQEKRYSLAPATKQLLQKLDDVLTVRVYISSGLPSDFNPLLASIEDTLDEVKNFGGKKIQIEYVDPLRSQIDEQKVQLLGIPPLQISVNTGNQQSVLKAYLGIALLFADRQEIIPYVGYQSNLEYEFAQALLKVSNPHLPKLGWYEGDTHTELFGGSFEKTKTVLGQRYDLMNVPLLEQKSLASLKTLVIASPGDLLEQELFELDQFLMQGGQVLVLADRWQVAQGMIVKEKKSPLFARLAHYGISVNRELVLDESNAPAPFSGGSYTMQLPYPAWVLLRHKNFAPQPMFAGFDVAVLPWATSLSVKTSDAQRSSTVLAESSATAVLLSASAKEKVPQVDREAALKQLQAGSKTQVPLAAEVSGVIASAYGENGLRPEVKGDFLQQSLPGAKLVVIATSRVAQNGFVELFPSDVFLLENILDSLTWGDVLTTVRNRDMSFSPLALINAETASWLKFFNIIFGPAFVLILASLVWFVRRRKLARLRKEFAA